MGKNCVKCGSKLKERTECQMALVNNNKKNVHICQACQMANNKNELERIEKEKELELRYEKERLEKEEWSKLLNSESVNKLEIMIKKNCCPHPGTCSVRNCSSDDKIVFANRWKEEKPTIYCAKCYLNYDHEGRGRKKELIEKDIIDNKNRKCDDCNKDISERGLYSERVYYRDGIQKNGILCHDCKGNLINKLATYERDEKQMITDESEEEIQSNNQLSTINRNKNNELILKKKNIDLQIENSDKNKIIQSQTNKIKELEQLLDKSQKKLINKEIDAKQNKLESLIQELEVERVKIIHLRNTCEHLIRARSNCNLADIRKAEEGIEEIKNELSIIKAKDMYKIVRKCEKVAKLRLQREKIYEAKQELALPLSKSV